MSWLTGIQARLIGAGILLLAVIAAVVWFGAHERGIGAAKVQAKWDLANAAQTKAAVAASESARATEHQQADAFAGIANTYLTETAHAYPSIADTLPAAVAAGTVRLRNDCPSGAGGAVSAATAASRSADAARTQALADRVAAAVEIVRIGESADARERQLDAQIAALQALLSAERAPQPRSNP